MKAARIHEFGSPDESELTTCRRQRQTKGRSWYEWRLPGQSERPKRILRGKIYDGYEERCDGLIHGIVLAPGEGRRLQRYIQEIRSEPLPKQYVTRKTAVAASRWSVHDREATEFEVLQGDPKAVERRSVSDQVASTPELN